MSINKTVSVSHDITIIMFKWKGKTYVKEATSKQTTKEMVEKWFETEPLILTSDPTLSGNTRGIMYSPNIVHVSISSPKKGDGNMLVQSVGPIGRDLDAAYAAVGTWGIAVTSSQARFSTVFEAARKSKGSDIEAIHEVLTDERFVIRFVGQVHTSSGHYFVDGSGNRRRDTVLRFKSWSAGLNVPLIFFDANLVKTPVPTALPQVVQIDLEKSLFGTLKEDSKRAQKEHADLQTNLQKSALDVFKWPLVGLVFFNYWNKDLSKGLIKEDPNFPTLLTKVANYPNVLSHGCLIPVNVVKALTGAKEVKLYDSWQEFMRLMSGVQRWNGDDGLSGIEVESAFNTSSYGGNGIVGNLSNFNGENYSWLLSDVSKHKRPSIPVTVEMLQKGYSIKSFIDYVVSSSNANESYTAFRYTRGENGKILTVPMFVVRDIPYSLRRNEAEMKDARDSSDKIYPWTYMDDLPAIWLDSAKITSFNVSSSADNIANSIIITPSSAVAAPLARSASMSDSAVLNGSQFRYGTNAMFTNVYEITATELDTNSGQYVLKKEVRSWSKEVARRLIEWYGMGHMAMSGTIMFKDDNDRPVPGDNVIFSLNKETENSGIYNRLCAHIENVEYRYSIRDGGQVSCESVISFSRMTTFRNDKEIKNKEDRLGAPTTFFPVKGYEFTTPPKEGGSLSAIHSENVQFTPDTDNDSTAASTSSVEQPIGWVLGSSQPDNTAKVEVPEAPQVPPPNTSAKKPIDPPKTASAAAQPKTPESEIKPILASTPKPGTLAAEYPVTVFSNLFEYTRNGKTETVTGKITSAPKLKTQGDSLQIQKTSYLGEERSTGKHAGVDVAPAMPSKSPDIKVLATTKAVVMFAGQQGNSGNIVILKPVPDDTDAANKVVAGTLDTAIRITYSHLDKIFVTASKDPIAAGTPIGVMGNTGRTTSVLLVDKKKNPSGEVKTEKEREAGYGRHLHIEYKTDPIPKKDGTIQTHGTPLDPADLFKDKQIKIPYYEN